MNSKETFRIPGWYAVHQESERDYILDRVGMGFEMGIRLGVQYQQIMSDPDRLDALDPESLKELRKVTDMLREG